jgi:hypothetical protein
MLSGPRTISSAHTPRRENQNQTTPNKIAKSEIDNHADTTCFGSNFTAISFTGGHCEVSPFTDYYNKMTDVPVATAATAWDNPDTGEVVILLFNQGLWFSETLTNSLINPNQCCMHGIEICDDPFDPVQSLGIKDPITGIQIPMDFAHSFVFLTTRAPTLEEIRTHTSIEMTDDAPWDPSKVGKCQLLWEEEEKRALIGSVVINDHIVGCTSPEEPQLHLDESDYDILLASCSSVYSKRTLTYNNWCHRSGYKHHVMMTLKPRKKTKEK